MSSNYSNSQVKIEERSLAEIISSFMLGVKRFWWRYWYWLLHLAFGYKRAVDSYVPMFRSTATISITAPVYNGDRDLSKTNDTSLQVSLVFHLITL